MNLSPVSQVDKELGASGICKKQEQYFTYQTQGMINGSGIYKRKKNENSKKLKPKQSTHIKNRSSKANKRLLMPTPNNRSMPRKSAENESKAMWK